MSHDIEQIRKNWREILNKLIDETDFDLVLGHQMSYGEWGHNNNWGLPEGIEGTSGATRMCFWDVNAQDIVYKILLDDQEIDYGANEVFIYKEAQKLGLEKWLAWTDLIDTIEMNGVITKVYAMDYCTTDADFLDEASSDALIRDYCDQHSLVWDQLSAEERDEIFENISEDEGTAEAMECFVNNAYSERHPEELFQFLWDYGVNDTHCGNWGYLDDKQLVLIDYGGYQVDLVARARA